MKHNTKPQQSKSKGQTKTLQELKDLYFKEVVYNLINCLYYYSGTWSYGQYKSIDPQITTFLTEQEYNLARYYAFNSFQEEVSEIVKTFNLKINSKHKIKIIK